MHCAPAWVELGGPGALFSIIGSDLDGLVGQHELCLSEGCKKQKESCGNFKDVGSKLIPQSIFWLWSVQMVHGSSCLNAILTRPLFHRGVAAGDRMNEL